MPHSYKDYARTHARAHARMHAYTLAHSHTRMHTRTTHTHHTTCLVCTSRRFLLPQPFRSEKAQGDWIFIHRARWLRLDGPRVATDRPLGGMSLLDCRVRAGLRRARAEASCAEPRARVPQRRRARACFSFSRVVVGVVFATPAANLAAATAVPPRRACDASTASGGLAAATTTRHGQGTITRQNHRYQATDSA
jgi:hypothetical protein